MPATSTRRVHLLEESECARLFASLTYFIVHDFDVVNDSILNAREGDDIFPMMFHHADCPSRSKDALDAFAFYSTDNPHLLDQGKEIMEVLFSMPSDAAEVEKFDYANPATFGATQINQLHNSGLFRRLVGLEYI